MASTYAPGYRTSYHVKTRSSAGEHEGDMEGTTHAATGMLAGTGIGLLIHAHAHVHGVALAENVGTDLLFGCVTAGMALLPDADHPKASFAYSAGFLSRGLSHLAAVAFGGHRAGLHSVFGVALFTLLAQWGAVWSHGLYPHIAVGAVLAMLIAAGLGATGFARGFTALAIGALVAGALLRYAPGQLWWMVALGMSIHIAEDMCTGHGVALLWPVLRRRIGGDGRQPARKRPAGSRPSPRPAGSPDRAAESGIPWRHAPAETAAPTAPYRTGKWRPGKLSHAMDWQEQCLGCLTGDHGDCTDQGCRCTRGAHPNRPGQPDAPRPPLPDEPPY